VARIQKAAAPFVQMENIANFLKAAEHLGVRKNELFQTVDLFEGTHDNAVRVGSCRVRSCVRWLMVVCVMVTAKNMSAVLVTLGALKRSKP
jgi:hypothetical protein